MVDGEKTEMDKRYSADKVKIEEAKTRRTTVVIGQACVFGLDIIGWCLLAASEIQAALVCLALSFVADLIFTEDSCTKASNKLNNMLQSYIQLGENEVRGIAFNGPCNSQDGMAFTVPYTLIRKVTAQTNQTAVGLNQALNWKTAGLNLTIETDVCTFKCLEIEQVNEVVELINRKIAETKGEASNVGTEESKFCQKCGAMLSDDSKFCTNCGTKQ